jgi:hypothetical protein
MKTKFKEQLEKLATQNLTDAKLQESKRVINTKTIQLKTIKTN